MAIIIQLDVMLAKRKMKLMELAELVNVTPQNLSVLKSGRAKAIRFSTLDAICAALKCNPGDILLHQTEQQKDE
ncbi:helix-turn-helix domain-containing protein [Paraglaciecola arctica]|uniref:Transcriptional regulator n=1 Tax=Paraglaciecola arctica BSs20135 TaxID=493475 RepID=K6X9B0_9ALTE|nr:helix-turn-helix transcriptional regulator [Paraglaciecola arctica]GAC17214.1 transcriptional regulator [Paraglaciecola arctica BSs20135]